MENLKKAQIEKSIYFIRGQRVMLDSDLAEGITSSSQEESTEIPR